MQQSPVQTQFQLDEVVWAKIIGYPFWPGQISCIIDKTYTNGAKDMDYVVNFIGDKSHSTLKARNLLKYQENYEICSRNKYKGLQNSIKLADAIIRDRTCKEANLKYTKIQQEFPTEHLKTEKQYDIELQTFLNCLTFKPQCIEMNWPQFNQLVIEIENLQKIQQTSNSGDIIKWIHDLLQIRESWILQNFSILPVKQMLQRLKKLNYRTKDIVNYIEDSLTQQDHQIHHISEMMEEEQSIPALKGLLSKLTVASDDTQELQEQPTDNIKQFLNDEDSQRNISTLMKKKLNQNIKVSDFSLTLFARKLGLSKQIQPIVPKQNMDQQNKYINFGTPKTFTPFILKEPK